MNERQVLAAAKRHRVKRTKTSPRQMAQMLMGFQSQIESLARKGSGKRDVLWSRVYKIGDIYKVSQQLRGILVQAQNFPEAYKWLNNANRELMIAMRRIQRSSANVNADDIAEHLLQVVNRIEKALRGLGR